jgi:hypothetical protein
VYFVNDGTAGQMRERSAEKVEMWSKSTITNAATARR